MTAIGSSQIQAGQKVRTGSLESVVTRFFVWAITRTWLATTEGAQAIIVRFGAHLVVGGLLVLAVALSGVQLPPKVQAQFALPTPTPAVDLGNRVESLFSMRGGSRMMGDETQVVRQASPLTPYIYRPRKGVISYTVQAGDTM